MIRVNNAFCQSLTSRYVAEKAGPVFISSLTLTTEIAECQIRHYCTHFQIVWSNLTLAKNYNEAL